VQGPLHVTTKPRTEGVTEFLARTSQSSTLLCNLIHLTWLDVPTCTELYDWNLYGKDAEKFTQFYTTYFMLHSY